MAQLQQHNAEKILPAHAVQSGKAKATSQDVTRVDAAVFKNIDTITDDEGIEPSSLFACSKQENNQNNTNKKKDLALDKLYVCLNQILVGTVEKHEGFRKALPQAEYLNTKSIAPDIIETILTSLTASSVQENYQDKINIVNCAEECTMQHVEAIPGNSLNENTQTDQVDDSQAPRSHTKEEMLMKKKSELLKKLQLSPLFWRMLEKYGVLIDTEIREIQKDVTTTEEAQKHFLISRLIVGTNYEYMGFLRTLVDTGQRHVVTDVLEEKTPETRTLNPPLQVRDRCLPLHKRKYLRNSRSQLSRMIKLSPIFWATLKDYGAITADEIEQIQSKGFALKQAQIYGLLNHLMMGTDDMYDGFMKTLCETGQANIVTNVLEEEQLLPENPIGAPDQVTGSERLSDKTADLLRTKLPELLENVRVSPLFWAQLMRHDIVTYSHMEEFKKGGTASEQVQVSSLIKHIMRLTNMKYEAFLTALIQTGQQHIVTAILGEDPRQMRKGRNLLSSDKLALLVWKLPALKQQVQLTEELWNSLITNCVMTTYDVKVFKDDPAGKPKQVRDIVEYLMLGSDQTYLHFLYALSEAGQTHVVTDILQEDVPHFTPAAVREQVKIERDTAQGEQENVFLQKLRTLKKFVQIKEDFWNAAVKNTLMTDFQVEQFQGRGNSTDQQVHDLLEYVRSGDLVTYRRFLATLCDTNQEYVVSDILQESVANMKPQPDISGVLLTPAKKRLIIDKGPVLIANIKPNAGFWASLIKYNVVTELDAYGMKVSKGNGEQIGQLLSHINTGTMAHYRGFIYSLLETNQGHIATEVLGEDTSTYNIMNLGSQITDPLPSEAIEQKEEDIDEVIRAIGTGSSHIGLEDVCAALNSEAIDQLKEKDIDEMFRAFITEFSHTGLEDVHAALNIMRQDDDRLDNCQTVPVPGTSRFIGIKQEDDETKKILTTNIYDCMVLQQQHIRIPIEGILEVILLHYGKETDRAGLIDLNQRWQEAVQHLLLTFDPAKLVIVINKAELNVTEGWWCMGLHDGRFHDLGWNPDCTRYVIDRLDRCRTVPVAGSSRCIRIHQEDDKPTTILTSSMSDCMNLQQQHIKMTTERQLLVWFPLETDRAGTPDRTEGWQQAIRHLLQTFHPSKLVIYLSKSELNVTEGLWHMGLQDGTFYNLTWNTNSTRYIIDRLDGFQTVPLAGTSRSIGIKQGDNKDTTILTGSMSDCMNLQQQHIKMTTDSKLRVWFPLETDRLGTPDRTEGWQHTVKHLLQSFHPAKLVIYLSKSELNVTKGLWHMGLQDGTFYDCGWNPKSTCYVIDRLDGFQTVPVAGTSRCIGIKRKNGETTMILTNISDCMNLQIHNIKMTRNNSLQVLFPLVYGKKTDRAGTPDITKVWQPAVQHLLKTFDPLRLVSVLNKSELNVTEGWWDIGLQDGTLNDCRWHQEKARYIIDRFDQCQTVPGTSQCVWIKNEDDETTKILTNSMSDCMKLKRQHIKMKAKDTLKVCLPLVFGKKTDSAGKPDQTDECQQAVQHLLQTFNPAKLVIYLSKSELNVTEGLRYMSLQDGMFYRCGMNPNNTRYVIDRLNGFHALPVPGTSRCIGIKRGNDETTMRLTNILDCMILQKEHINMTTEGTLQVGSSETDAAGKPDVTEEWQQAVQYLLQTFNPAKIVMDLRKSEENPTEGISYMSLQEGTFYECGWNSASNRYIIDRLDGCQTVPVPGASRCVRIKHGDDETTILTHTMSDCMALSKQDIINTEFTLHVIINPLIPQEAALKQPFPQTAGWRQSIHHLLQTFHPPRLTVHVLRAQWNMNISVGKVVLQDGREYHMSWDDDGESLVIPRFDSGNPMARLFSQLMPSITDSVDSEDESLVPRDPPATVDNSTAQSADLVIGLEDSGGLDSPPEELSNESGERESHLTNRSCEQQTEQSIPPTASPAIATAGSAVTDGQPDNTHEASADTPGMDRQPDSTHRASADTPGAVAGTDTVSTVDDSPDETTSTSIARAAFKVAFEIYKQL